jgi:arylsulfatase
VPLLENSSAPWPDRLLFTHLGRWPKLADPQELKFSMCSVRDPRWHLVSDNGGREPAWKLFDVQADYGETTDVAEREPDVVKRLAGAYDQWWADVQPLLINERVLGPKINPFKEMFWQQFGGGPSAELLEQMDPSRQPPASGKKKAKKKQAG